MVMEMKIIGGCKVRQDFIQPLLKSNLSDLVYQSGERACLEIVNSGIGKTLIQRDARIV